MTEKNKRKSPVILIIIAAAAVWIGIAVTVVLLVRNTGKIEVYEDLTRYEEVMSFQQKKADSKWYKWGMDESIWPRRITDPGKVSEFRMVYYDPWDAQYLGFLVIDYPAAEYSAEIQRLKAYPSAEYTGYYSVREETTFELAAVYADPYYGFVYALTDGQSRIIYAEQIFCNYFMDLDYGRYIPQEYLLDGFDASPDNPYRQKMMKQR